MGGYSVDATSDVHHFLDLGRLSKWKQKIFFESRL